MKDFYFQHYLLLWCGCPASVGVPDEEAATFISNQNGDGLLRCLRQILLAFHIFEFAEEFKSAIM